jgi:aminopeptidase N
VTCRDWFQLTLKEGLTVFRDQEFSGDLNSKPVKRIEDVRVLRAHQFREDSGPMSHPVRPDSYMSMDNFYTSTVYNKGAEVIRMYQTILTPEGFNKGMDLYFDRHDGSAVTCDDFLAAMADANDVDLSQFARWYSTPGTPVVHYDTHYDSKKGTYTLTLRQTSRSPQPLHIPIAVGLLDKASGREVVPTTVLNLKEASQTFSFDNLSGDVVPSILRDFSAPIKLIPESGTVDEEALAFLAAYDTDGFNRWEAAQQLYSTLIFQAMQGEPSTQTMDRAMEAFGRALRQDSANADYSIQAYTLTLPTESTLAEDMEVIDPALIHKARGTIKKAIARKFQSEMLEKYTALTRAMEQETEFKVDAQAIGRRRLRNTLLEYLCALKETDAEQETAATLALNHYQKARGMTDKMAALSALASMKGKGVLARDTALEEFYKEAQGNALVVNKWFTVQAMADLPDVLDRVRKLTKHPDFTLKNPNRCRSLLNAFTANMNAFHDKSGDGYRFVADMIAEIDPINQQVSSRMANSLIQWRRYDSERGNLMKAELERLSQGKLSEDLYEIVTKGLNVA